MRPCLIKCNSCNDFLKLNYFLEKDILNIKKNKLIQCVNCKSKYKYIGLFCLP